MGNQNGTFWWEDSKPSDTAMGKTLLTRESSTDAAGHHKPVKEGVLFGLGNPLLDISVFGDEAFLKKYHLEANNAILVADHQRSIFEDMQSMNPIYMAGGSTQNTMRVAQWLLQRPNATTFFGAVGDDAFATILEHKAREVGVNVRYQVHKGKKTGVCGVIITGDNRSLVTELGAAALFSEDHLGKGDHWDLLEKARVCYVGGFVMSVSPDAVLNIAKFCAEENKVFFMNLSATFVVRFFVDPALGLMQYIDILVGNKQEAEEITRHAGFKAGDLKQMALEVAAMPKINTARPRLVIFTQGSSPIVVALGSEVREVPVEPVEPGEIVDTNGCGDSFAGGFLSQLVQGASINQCLRCGSYAAKVVLHHSGCNFPEKPNFF